MRLGMRVLILQVVVFLLLGGLLPTQALIHRYKFVVKEAPYTKLCSTKNILTVNGQFPGPTLRLRQGDTAFVHVHNKGKENITIHWHGVNQPRYPWSDGPEYITQCPMRPGTKFTQKIVLSDEIGTLWWHAHSDWSRATVHGLLVVYPKKGSSYPLGFPKLQAEVPMILGEWWKSDIQEVLSEFSSSGGEPNVSDAFLINGQPGLLYPCSRQDSYKLTVDYGKTYLLRMVNAAMNNILFFSIAKHRITVVGSDGSYTKPLNSGYIAISPGQTIDFLLHANQSPNLYYMAAKAYNSASSVTFDNTTTTAILKYRGNYTPPSSPSFPNLPTFNETIASANFTGSLRSLASKEFPVDVPKNVTTNLLFTLSLNSIPCETNNTCKGPRGNRFAASVNNMSFVSPKIDILQAYYNQINGVYKPNFPSFPPLVFNYTASNLSISLQTPTRTTKVKVLEYNSHVELVYQATNLVAGIDHPMHLHGHSFYVVGWGFGNFDEDKDPKNYNLEDPPLMNTIAVPKNGWTAIRFKANNPAIIIGKDIQSLAGVWLMHCHLERHISWGMEMTFIVKNGKRPQEKLLPPPPDMPLC